RIQRNTPSRQYNAQVNEVGSESDDSEDDVEEMILGNNMNLAEHSEDDFVFHRTAIGLIDAPADWVTAVTPLVVVNADSMEINAAQNAVKAAAPENKLMIVQGAIDGKSVRILIDCGASNLLCRPGLAKKVIRSKEVQAEGFDGHCSGIKKVKEAAGTLCFGQWTFSDLIFTEWDLGKKDFDIILGKPWFFRFNPI
ncbi:hypothetical protein As57867_006777, partial [Aphanomyces stellatus]